MISVLRVLKAMCVLACLFVLGADFAHAQPGAPVFTLFQGLVQKSGTVTSGAGLVVDPSGNIYVADQGSNAIVKISAQGVQTTLAITGLGTALSSPGAVALDGSGNLYIADTGNSRIVMVTPSLVGTVVAMGSVTLSHPSGVVVDNSGNLFISNSTNNRIVEIPSGGAATFLTLTGLGTTLSAPLGLATDLTGNLYIADSLNSRIVKVAAGTSTATVVTGLILFHPASVAVDATGNLFVASYANNTIAELDTLGSYQALTTPSTTLNNPNGVALDVFGRIYISDSGDGAVYTVSPQLVPAITSGSEGYSLNKTAVGFGHSNVTTGSTTTLTLPYDLAATVVNSVSILTSGTASTDFTVGSTNTCTGASITACSVSVNFRPTAPGLRTGAIVFFNSSGAPIISVPLFGFGDAPMAAVGGTNVASVVSTGGVATANPRQIALDGAGNMYVANYSGSPEVIKIPAGGGTAATITTPGVTLGTEIAGIAVDGAGNVYISDYLNNQIVVVTPAGTASVMTINGLSPLLSGPKSLAIDGAGNLYIAASQNSGIIEVSNIVVSGSTSAGLGRFVAYPGVTFTPGQITGISVSPSGTIYIAAGPANSSKVVQITAAGVVSTVTTTGFTTSVPLAVYVDGMGNLYIVDSLNDRVLRVTSSGVASAFSLSGVSSLTTLANGYGITADAYGNLYIPDFTNSRIVSVPTSSGTLSFAGTNIGSTSTDSPQTATITNLGNQSLVVAALGGNGTNFTFNTSDTSLCTLVASVATGQTCDISVKFTPQAAGSLSSNIAVSDNYINLLGSQQSVYVSGTGIQTADTTGTAVAILPTSIVNGQTATITATVTDTQAGKTATIPTGSVTFTDTVSSTTISLNGGTAVTLSGTGTASITGVQLSGIGTHTIAANYGGVTNTFQTSSGNTTAPVTLTPVTLTSPATQPLVVNYQQASLFTEFVSGPYTTLPVPSGSLSYTILNSSSTSVASGTKTLTTGSTNSSADIPIVGTLSPGNYTIQITYSGDANYQASVIPTVVTLTITQVTPTLAWVPSPSSLTYGANLTGVLDATATYNSTTVAGTFTYTATPAGGSPAAVTNASVLSAGTYSLATFFTPTDTVTYSTVSKTISYTVNKLTPTIALTSSVNPLPLGNSTTFTATVTSTVGTPTGTVSFYSGTTLLGTVTLSSGVAAFATSSLASGADAITAVYSGSANFLTVTSAVLTENVSFDFTVVSSGGTAGAPPTATVLPGGTGNYTLTITPISGTVFPLPTTLTITGLPTGATVTVAPTVWVLGATNTWTLPANTPITPLTISITTAAITAMNEHHTPLDRKLPLLALGVLLLPFSSRMRRAARRAGRTISVLLVLVAGLAAVAGLTGCGATNGFFGQGPQTYTVTETVTTGTVSHSSTVTLTIQ